MSQFTGKGFSVNAEFWNRIAKREPFFARRSLLKMATPMFANICVHCYSCLHHANGLQ